MAFGVQSAKKRGCTAEKPLFPKEEAFDRKRINRYNTKSEKRWKRALLRGKPAIWPFCIFINCEMAS